MCLCKCSSGETDVSNDTSRCADGRSREKSLEETGVVTADLHGVPENLALVSSTNVGCNSF